MSKVLFIKANPKQEKDSFSLWAGEEFIKLYKMKNPQDKVIEIDVYNTNIPLIDADVLNGWAKLQSGTPFENLNDAEREKISTINKLTDEFVAADKYVFVTPLWNFTIPPMMKAYIDTVCIAGKTFKYTENGPIGLLKNKKALHIQASGGIYSEGPFKEMELGNRYIKTILSFIGVTELETIFVEGTAIMPAEEIKNNTLNKIKEVANKF